MAKKRRRDTRRQPRQKARKCDRAQHNKNLDNPEPAEMSRTKRKKRWKKQCKKKRVYRTIADARKAGEYITIHGDAPAPLYIYECKSCGNYHLTKARQRWPWQRVRVSKQRGG